MDLALNEKKINMSKSMICKKNSKCEKREKRKYFVLIFHFSEKNHQNLKNFEFVCHIWTLIVTC
jgi:hypothetical protein